MIRHKPTYMALNAFVAACGAFLMVSLFVSSPSRVFSPLWVYETVYGMLVVISLHNIAKNLRGPIRDSSLVRSIGNRNLWIVKGVLIGFATVLFIVGLIERYHRP